MTANDLNQLDCLLSQYAQEYSTVIGDENLLKLRNEAEERLAWALEDEARSRPRYLRDEEE